MMQQEEEAALDQVHSCCISATSVSVRYFIPRAPQPLRPLGIAGVRASTLQHYQQSREVAVVGGDGKWIMRKRRGETGNLWSAIALAINAASRRPSAAPPS